MSELTPEQEQYFRYQATEKTPEGFKQEWAHSMRMPPPTGTYQEPSIWNALSPYLHGATEHIRRWFLDPGNQHNLALAAAGWDGHGSATFSASDQAGALMARIDRAKRNLHEVLYQVNEAWEGRPVAELNDFVEHRLNPCFDSLIQCCDQVGALTRAMSEAVETYRQAQGEAIAGAVVAGILAAATVPLTGGTASAAVSAGALTLIGTAIYALWQAKERFEQDCAASLTTINESLLTSMGASWPRPGSNHLAPPKRMSPVEGDEHTG